VPRPELRIVDDTLWERAHARLAERCAMVRARPGSHGGPRPRDIDSPYLLSGFARCATCHGPFFAAGRTNGASRSATYGCGVHRKRGPGACPNGLRKRVADVDAAVLATVGDDVLAPNAVMALVDGMWETVQPANRRADDARVRDELRDVERA